MHGAARLTTLAIRDFRNLERIDLVPPADGFVVVGENGHGKTNLLEAIQYLELMRSGRGARDQDVVRFGCDGFHMGATVDGPGAREVSIGFERSSKRKRVRVDGVVAERLSDALGAVPVVQFSPADVELVCGAPSVRRRYLDIVLALTVPGYLGALQRYRTALGHRNAALRTAVRGGGDGRVAVWEPALAEHGAVLWRERAAWTTRVAGRFGALCAAIGEDAPVTLRYVSPGGADAGLREALAAALEAKRPHDIRRGVTHAGPHRDELAIALVGGDGAARELRAFGSAGQQRTAAIALRMLEAETLRDARGGAPIFLLDDPFAELDARRSARILALLAESGLGQTILAVPRDTDIPPEMRRLARYTMRGGTLAEAVA